MKTGKRGPRSAADIVTLRPVYTEPRQQLPEELSGDEAEVFLDIVNSEEAAWFTKANLPLLVQYSRHVIQARRLAALIEAAVGRSGTDWVYYAGLLTQQRAESMVLAGLATKMRISAQALRNPRGNRPTIAPPWEHE